MIPKIGMCIPNYGMATSKEALDDFADLAENLRYESIWTTDHLLIPKDFASQYGKSLESLSSLTYLAAKTASVKLGTSIIVFPMREVILFAKQASAIQILSDNRLILGLGAGWNREEFSNVRADFENRGRYYDEGIQLFRRLVRGNVEFKGVSYSITNGVFEPLPKKEIPILIGGNGKIALRRVVKLGDGWFPVGPSVEQIAQGVEKLKSLTDRKLEITVRLAVEFSNRKGELSTQAKGARGDAQTRLAGTFDEISTQIDSFGKVGADRIIVYFGDKDLSSLKVAASKFGEQIIASM